MSFVKLTSRLCVPLIVGTLSTNVLASDSEPLDPAILQAIENQTLDDIEKIIKDGKIEQAKRKLNRLNKDGPNKEKIKNLEKEIAKASKAPDAESMTLFIKTISGKRIKIEVDADKTVLDVKLAIKEKEKIPVDDQRLISNGKEVQNDVALTSLNLKMLKFPFQLIVKHGGNNKR